MRNFLRFSLRVLPALLLIGLAPETKYGAAAQEKADSATVDPHQANAASSLPSDPRALYEALNELKLDPTQVFSVSDLTLRRDALHFAFTEGKLVFFQPLGGKVTGVVFFGRGHVVATPRDPGERRSLSQYLGVPILDQTFTSAYLRFTDDTATELKHEIETNGTQPVNDSELVARWERGLMTLASPHSLRIMEDLLSREPLPYFYALLQNDAVGRFDALVDDRRKEEVLIGQARMENGVPTYDVWASFRAEATSAKPLEHFVPVGYAADSTIAEDLSLDGRTNLDLKAVRSGERVVHLELSRNLTVTEILGDDGGPVTFFQNQDLSPQDVMRRGNDEIVVVLPEAKNGGDEFHLQVKYHGNVITSAGNGVEFVGERGTWFAHVGGEHFASFDLTFRWPKRLTLVATGAKVESREEGEFKWGHWRSEVPFATAGFNLGEYKVAMIGDAPKVRIYANNELEEAIAKRLEERGVTQLESTPDFVHPLSGTLSTVVVAAPPPSPSATLNELGSQVLDSIRYFDQMNGPFPFEHLDIAQIPGSFGQGWPELVYLSTLAFLPASTQEEAGIGEWTQRGSRNLMPFHEVVHQWWGNQTVAASYRDTWITEAVANYLAILYSDSKKPGEHRLAGWLEHYKTELLAKPAGATEPLEQIGPLTLGQRLASAKVPDAYATIMYGKGTWVIHMLRQLMREPGSANPDAKFRDLLQSVLKDYKFQALTTRDFQRAIERHMNAAMDIEGTHHMDWFFDDWVRGIGVPHYSVKFEVKERGQGFLVSGTLEQKGVADSFTAPVPIYGTRVGGKQERLGVVVTSGAETHFRFTAKTRPSRIVIDPQLTLLCSTNQ
ncbi:MAG TPA: M1 family aminopeptidase [Candidatus Acidoferrales bacterium]